jgi:hypothetical protein
VYLLVTARDFWWMKLDEENTISDMVAVYRTPCAIPPRLDEQECFSNNTVISIASLSPYVHVETLNAHASTTFPKDAI